MSIYDNVAYGPRTHGITNKVQLDEGTDMPREDVSLRVLSEEVCETLSDAARMKNVSLEVTGDDGVINGVRRLLYEIVYNLCDNAIKYNNSGGSVKVSVEQKPGIVCLSVQDTGIGISSEHRDKVFERFYRVDKSHSKQSAGTELINWFYHRNPMKIS